MMPAYSRIVVFDAPDPKQLLERVQTLQPEFKYFLASDLDLSVYQEEEGIPIWYLAYSTIENKASKLLNSFVYPLVASNYPFCIAFPFSTGVFRPKSLDFQSRQALDVEDIGLLLASDAVQTTWELLPQLRQRIELTPIEQELARAMERAGLKFEYQVKFGQYRVDFLIKEGSRLIAVEADGLAYHDPERDRKRDEALQKLGIDKVLHFTGGQIYRDADMCAQIVLNELRHHRHERDDSHLSNLDDSQRAAVCWGDGPARVLAPAGSGKTLTLVKRVVELVRRGVDPNHILILAFNKKAAQQLKRRLKSEGIPHRERILEGYGVLCATFHAFGYRYQKEIMGVARRTESSREKQRRRMREAIEETLGPISSLKIARGSDPVGRFLRALHEVKLDLRSPEDIHVELTTYENDKHISLEFTPIYNAYEERALGDNVQSFADQIFLCAYDLLHTPEHRRRLQTLFTHILVDEYQDLNEAQLTIIDILSRPYRNLFVVGDDDQLIYGWRFARLPNILNFHKRMPVTPYSKTFTLSVNYRSSAAVVDYSRRLIQHNKLRETKNVRAREGASRGLVRIVASPRWKDRANAMVDFIRREKHRHGSKWRDIAVLCRYRSQQLLAAVALDGADIPRSPLLSYRVFSSFTAELLKAYIQLVLDPERTTSEQMRMLLNRPNRYIPNAYVEKICSAPNPWRAVIDIASSSDKVAAKCGSLVRRARTLNQRFRTRNLHSAQLVDDIVREFELLRYWEDRTDLSSAERDEGGPVQVLEAIRLLADFYPDIDAFLRMWAEKAEAEEANLDMSDDSLEREEDDNEDRVVISTIHAAKGREYKSVVVLDYFPPDLSRLDTEEIEEERRVLYVAITRASDTVLVTVDTSKDVPQFIRELIRPCGKGEEASLLKAKETISQEILDLTAKRAELLEEMEEIKAGTALERAETILEKELIKMEEKHDELKSLESQVPRGGIPYLWGLLTGRVQHCVNEIARLRKSIEEGKKLIAELKQRVQLLKHEPEALVRDLEGRIKSLEKTIRDKELYKESLEGRLVEIHLLHDSPS